VGELESKFGEVGITYLGTFPRPVGRIVWSLDRLGPVRIGRYGYLS